MVAFVAPQRQPRVSTEELLFPSFHYYLDESDPDIVILRRSDDSFVAAFSAIGATREGILQAAREDYQELIQDQPGWRGQTTEEHRRA
jgi:hypothetical protein